MDTHILSPVLAGLAIMGTLALLIMAGRVIWYYRDARLGSFRRRLYNFRLKQLSAIACLFFLAMAASYAVLHEGLFWLFLVFSFKCATWWIHYAMSERLL